MDSAAPDAVLELCEACRNYTHRATGIELDYTAETLPVLDHYIASARADVEEREALGSLLVRAIGAYFGELVRRRWNGHWRLTNELDIEGWRVCGRYQLLAFNPAAFAAEALAGTGAHSGPSAEIRMPFADRERIRERLERMPPVPESEYFLLSTRLEVLDVIVETLQATNHDESSPVEYELDDYEQDAELIGSP